MLHLYIFLSLKYSLNANSNLIKYFTTNKIRIITIVNTIITSICPIESDFIEACITFLLEI